MLKQIYNTYHNSQGVRNIYYRYLGSQRAAKFHFGIDCQPHENGYAMFDLATILLKWELESILRSNPNLKCLEIGTGRYAILSGYLAKYSTNIIDTCELIPDLVENSKKTMELNNIKLNVFQSDLFSNVPKGNKYDLLFWNLPYYLDPQDYLVRVLGRTKSRFYNV